MVDHHFANASQGAIGLIYAGGKPEAKGDIEHHNIPATANADRSRSGAGQARLREQVPRLPLDRPGPQARPRLGRRDQAAQPTPGLTKWLKSPEKMLDTDADAKAMLKEYNSVPMPNQNLSDAEIRQYIRYFQWADEQQRADTGPRKYGK